MAGLLWRLAADRTEMSLQSHHPLFPQPTIVAGPPHGLLLLRDVLICSPPLGFFLVVRSFRATGCFLLLAGCFVFMGTLCFCFCGYDLLTGLARTPKVTRRPPRTFSLGMRSSKRWRVLLWRLAADRPERSLQSQDMPPVARRAPSNRRGVRLVYRYRPPPEMVTLPPERVRILGPVFGMPIAPPLGFFLVLRSFRATFCFLLAGCLDFMGTLCFLVLWL